ncbi:FtsW/RodA/SpoVE family cell cycle protein [Pseudoduganella sp. GCM10020061]|uniref:FtsW/RodA/SpoVE family cell cycle protein n=1 Tax=Pseudoduganella sp. GCM10020061 TaxID=3317345 RepID=UPI00362A207D
MGRRWDLFHATAAALALLCLLQLAALLRAPESWMPSAITVSLQRGEAVTLGRDELAAPHAAAGHMTLGRDAGGRWFVGAGESAPPVTLMTGDSSSRSGSIALAGGQQFTIGTSRVVIASEHDGVAQFSANGASWRFDGATLYRNDTALAPCPDTPLAARAVAMWNRAVPRLLTVARPMTIGGNLHCGNRLGVPYVAPASASVTRRDGGLVIAQSSESTAPLMMGSAFPQPLARLTHHLDGVDALIVGRTRFAIEQSGDALVLKPSRYVTLYSDPQVTLPGQVAWTWRQRGLWTIPASGAWMPALALLALAASAAIWAFQRGHWPFVRHTARRERIAAGVSLLVAICGVTALLLQRAGAPPGAGASFLLASAALWSCLLLPGRLSLAWASGLLLLATGLLAQLELGLGAFDSSWLRHYQKTSALLSIGLGTGEFVALRMRAGSVLARQAVVELALVLLACGALAALAMQVLFGDETGVFDLQPVEFAKLALTALTAHCLAVGLGWHHSGGDTSQRWRRWLRMAAPVLLFLALLAVALVQVDDFSPLILLLVWGASMGFVFSLASRTRWASAALVSAALAVCGAIVLLRWGGTLDPSGWSFYGDRFLVWLEPLRHPHTGQQLLMGAQAIAQGSWFGADNLLGLASLGDGAGSGLAIPAVQDDFAPSFFLNRHGLAGALLLWCLQAAFLAGLFATAARAFAASRAARDFRQAWLARFRCFALCGGAAFVLGHFLLSWGTNLAVFPIMGQPMSFLSAGGSHLLFFICPLLAFGAISAQSFEEIESCRSMSNTKS